ncbi:Mog1p/PsbP-like protein [Wolfiporia cocos MD-104 SS10]|uniref:Mog1p/PsbP-like protein n=1 Tax=Wolfiporia cocos (strain MD-104) TaxID=742152 RepID=A0A2H3J8T0_WOLCO|nr:Mog1p/PsbP-like protein [Wolfiporia cocos MD-104 SS10]
MAATRPLFGGAITITLPTELVDASDFRQVPDTQEVYLYPNSGISVIVEVLQSVNRKDMDGIARFHFDALAHDNDAEGQSVLDITCLSDIPGDAGQTPAPIVLTGTQLVRKYNRIETDEIRILLAVYRVQDRNVDLVMSMNVPIKTSDGGAVSEDDWSSAKHTFDTAARSLRIVDYGLFA